MNDRDNVRRIVNISSITKKDEPMQSSNEDGYDAATAPARLPRCVRARSRSRGSYIRRAA